MSEQNIVYVVTSGEYSGYSIHAVFSTKEKAEEYIAHDGYFSDSYEIEEYVLDGEQPDMSEKLYEIDIDYNTFDANLVFMHSCSQEQVDMFKMIDSDTMRMWILTTDSKRAIKIASERLGQIKSQEWKYPLMHNICTFRIEHEYKCLSEVRNSRPFYSFHTGEMVLQKNERLIGYTAVDKKTGKEITIQFK